MAFIVNLNGEITPSEQAKISVLDRGFLYGDSVYEVMRTYHGRVFAAHQHFERLTRSAEQLGIPLPPRQFLLEELQRTLEMAGNDESYCRLIVTRGDGPLTLDPTQASDPALVIFVKEYEPFPDWMYRKGIRLAIPNVRRTTREALDPAIKSGNYLNSVIAFGEARRQGFDDALILDGSGRVTESTSSNVFAVLRGELCTPPLETGLLAGVTRGIILMLALEQGIPARQRQLTPHDLAQSDEVFLTSTLREVLPVVQVDKYQIGEGTPGPLAKKLREILHEYAGQSVLKSSD